MTRIVVPAQIVVDFQTNVQRRIDLILDGGVRFNFRRRFRVYPPVKNIFAPGIGTAPLNPTVGTINQIGGTLTDTITSEPIKFDNSFSAQTRYPYPRTFLFETDKSYIIRTGNAVGPGAVAFEYDEDTDSIIAQDPLSFRPITVSGQLVLTYTVNYSYYEYVPVITNAVINGTTHAGNGGALLIYGSVYGFNGEASDSVTMIPPGFSDNEFVEYYRVFSRVVADNTYQIDSLWELPPNWPAQGGGTDALPAADYGFGTDGPNEEEHFIDDRIHEQGFINRVGDTDTKFPSTSRLNRPYTGSSSFTPRYIYRTESSPPDPGYASAWGGIDWSQIRDSVEDRWPGVTGG